MLLFGAQGAASWGAGELRSISAYVNVFACSLNKVRKLARQHSGVWFAPGRDCTENTGLLVAQALLGLTAKLVQQANYLQTSWLFVRML